MSRLLRFHLRDQITRDLLRTIEARLRELIPQAAMAADGEDRSRLRKSFEQRIDARYAVTRGAQACHNVRAGYDLLTVEFPHPQQDKQNRVREINHVLIGNGYDQCSIPNSRFSSEGRPES